MLFLNIQVTGLFTSVWLIFFFFFLFVLRFVPQVVQAGPTGGKPVPEFSAGRTHHAVLQLHSHFSAKVAFDIPAFYVVCFKCEKMQDKSLITSAMDSEVLKKC